MPYQGSGTRCVLAPSLTSLEEVSVLGSFIFIPFPMGGFHSQSSEKAIRLRGVYAGHLMCKALLEVLKGM